jgi:hypothetical protein
MATCRLLVIFGAMAWAHGATAAPPPAPAPKAIASGQEAVSQIAVDAANVYWVSSAGLFRAPRTGGSPSRLWDKGAAAVAVDDKAIYVGGPDGLWALSKTDGRPVELVKGTRVSGIALDSANLYISSGVAGSLSRVSKRGGPTATLAQIPSAGIGDVEVDYGFVYFTVLRPRGQGGAIMRVDKRGGTVTTVYDGDRVDGSIAVGSDDLYFGKSGDEKHNYRNGQLLRIRKLPSAATPAVLASDVAVPVGVALGDGFLYAIAMGSAADMKKGRVVRVPLAGGRLETLVDGQGEPYVLAFDNGDLFWSALLDQAVRSLPVAPPEAPAGCAGTAIDLDDVASAKRCDVPSEAEPPPPGDGQLVVRLEPARVTVAPGESAEVAIVVENVTDRPRAFSWNGLARSELRDGRGQRADEHFQTHCAVGTVVGASWTPRRITLAPKGRATAHVSVDAEVTSYDCDYNGTSRPLRRGTYRLRVTTPLGDAAGVLVVR